ncbi:Hypothetical_protein [Hexamita inflata]|uniref:Hypothetical_protein n=1 Tax=Hexamita inflata TaxID=28002 RepID=A0AA86UAR2_9EUKA|nr:Hypothetical protein HINF_LOCUS31547 [Hexamita inflata]
MPFVVRVENGQHLEIAWSDDENAQNIDANILNESYNHITVDGQDNIEFTDYQILSRTQSLGITGCTVDLSKIHGSINYISFNKCKCINSCIELSMKELYIDNVQLQVSQLTQLSVIQIYVKISDEVKFDYYNCYQLNAKINSLTLINQQVDLNLLQGSWDSVHFENCEFIGQVDNNKFKVQSVDVVINEQNSQNNQKSLEDLECEYFSLSQQEKDDYQHLELIMTNENNQKKQMYAQFQKCFCDLSLIQGSWNIISFHNCMLVGNPNNYKQQQFSTTNINITLDQHCPEIDLSPLHGIASKVSITINNVQVDLSSVAKCKPFQLNLKDCTIDCAQLVGNWNYLNIFNCEFKQTNDLITASIIAEKITVSNVDSKLLDYFSTKVLEISKLKQPLLKFPIVNQLTIKRSVVIITESNSTVQHISLVNAKLIKFNILNLKNLQSIDLNSIQKHHTDFTTKQKILSYLQFQKKNKGSVKNLKRRAENHRNGVEKQNTFLEKLKVYLQNNLYKMVRGSFALCYE